MIIKTLNSDKAHGWDNISVRMIQLCGKEIILPLQLLFKPMLEDGIFLEDWLKGNAVRVYKKENANLIKNYHLVSLLSIFSKIFEKLLFNSLFNSFMQNKLFTEYQSGSYLVTHALHSCCQFHMKFIKGLIITHQLTRAEFFLIFRKPLIKSGMKV